MSRRVAFPWLGYGNYTGDLIGALRFPAGAFSAAAGTDVVADLLVLRRRGDGDERRGLPWAATVTLPGDEADGGEPVYVNELFATRPSWCS